VDETVVHRFDVENGLVGFDLQYFLALFDLIAILDQPFDRVTCSTSAEFGMNSSSAI
jgi:hypothetical protein